MGFVGRVFGRDFREVSRICSPLRSAQFHKPPPFSLLLTVLRFLSYANQCSGWDETELCLLGNIPQCSGSWVHTLLSHSPMGTIMISLGSELCCIEEKETQIKWNCFSYPLQCICSQIFCSTKVLKLLRCTPRLLYRCSHLGVVAKIDIFMGNVSAETVILLPWWGHPQS